MARRFVPEAGDIVWLEFSPQAGHEQAGHRVIPRWCSAPPPTTAKPAPCCAAR